MLPDILIDNFGCRNQYYESDYAIVKDLHGIKEHEIKLHKLNTFISNEEILSDLDFDNKLTWYTNQFRNLLNDYNFDKEIVNEIHSVLNIDKPKLLKWLKVLLRDHAKIKSLVFYGKSNTGKSIIANALLYPFAPGLIMRAGTTNVHWLEAIYRKNFILWEEPTVTMTTIEDVKLLMGGETIIINRKNEHLIERKAGPAVLITTNRSFWNYRVDEIGNRSVFEYFTTPVSFNKQYSQIDFAAYIYGILVYG